MLLVLLAYLGGVLTIVSLCILPVLPFVFARGDRPFLRSGLPLLVGMAVSFAAVATLAAVGGGWAVSANQYGRWAALALLALFGLALIFPSLSERLTRPLVGWGARLSERAGRGEARGELWSSLLLGAATGLLWAPCAGPILGLIFTGAALNGANAGTTLLLLAYALGAATSLALALLVGGKLFQRMKRSLRATERIRQLLGVLVIAGVAAIALGLDTRVLAKISSSQTNAIESTIAAKLGVQGAASSEVKEDRDGKLVLGVEGRLPAFDGLGPWFNSPPLTAEGLRGKVVLIDFWTYSCINCIRALPYVRAWHERYAKHGLVVIGVHAPEFAFERDPANVRKAIADLKVPYPVALDNRYALWRAFNNRYWPAHYFIDAKGRVRYHHFGEGSYDKSERVIRALLVEAGRDPGDSLASSRMTQAAQAAAARASRRSPETYLGHGRAERFASPGGLQQDKAVDYRAPSALLVNQWAFNGRWTVLPENSRPETAGGRIAYRFHARDLHLVMGAADRPVRFRITLDGKPPGADAGADVAPDGTGTVTGERLYQLVRQKGAVGERTFEIIFLDPKVDVFAFTFG
jgi:cytochrome c biogenesis protein CcdA/thiol-disulfide isomerase/thioredoxin